MKKNQNVKILKNKETIPLKLRILYNSPSCIVVNKLIGEAVEGAKKGMVDLQKELALLSGGGVELTEAVRLVQAVNRLDVPVTGCALFALTKKSLAFLNNAFAEGIPSVEKKYWAITEKLPVSLPESAEYTHWIETNSRINKSFAYEKEKKGLKKAALRYRKIAEGDNYLFLEIDLLSGRHHQIRAQLAAIGLHIKGDLKYGARRSEKEGGIRLHARSLSFPNPMSKNEIIHVTANPPQEDNLWNDFLNLLKNRQTAEEF